MRYITPCGKTWGKKTLYASRVIKIIKIIKNHKFLKREIFNIWPKLPKFQNSENWPKVNLINPTRVTRGRGRAERHEAGGRMVVSRILAEVRWPKVEKFKFKKKNF